MLLLFSLNPHSLNTKINRPICKITLPSCMFLSIIIFLYGLLLIACSIYTIFRLFNACSIYNIFSLFNTCTIYTILHPFNVCFIILFYLLLTRVFIIYPLFDDKRWCEIDRIRNYHLQCNQCNKITGFTKINVVYSLIISRKLQRIFIFFESSLMV